MSRIQLFVAFVLVSLLGVVVATRIADGAGAMQVPERAVTRRARRRLSTVEATSTGVTEA